MPDCLVRPTSAPPFRGFDFLQRVVECCGYQPERPAQLCDVFVGYHVRVVPPSRLGSPKIDAGYFHRSWPQRDGGLFPLSPLLKIQTWVAAIRVLPMADTSDASDASSAFEASPAFPLTIAARGGVHIRSLRLQRCWGWSPSVRAFRRMGANHLDDISSLVQTSAPAPQPPMSRCAGPSGTRAPNVPCPRRRWPELRREPWSRQAGHWKPWASWPIAIPSSLRSSQRSAFMLTCRRLWLSVVHQGDADSLVWGIVALVARAPAAALFALVVAVG